MADRTRYPFPLAVDPPAEAVDGIRTIFCPVCGRTAAMAPFTDNRRESGTCSSCGSWNRQRLLAVLLLGVIERMTGVRPAHLSAREVPDTLRIYSAEWFGALHATLRRLPGYAWSRYSGPAHRSGDVVEGHPHQDLLATSYPDASCDLVLTADVLEHIVDPYEAHREIHRILKPGGAHVFTVPSRMNSPLDDRRATVVDGAVVHHAPPEWHGVHTDANLVYTVFGLEMIPRLGSLGFDVQFHELSLPEMGIVGPRAFGFVAVKQRGPRPAD